MTVAQSDFLLILATAFFASVMCSTIGLHLLLRRQAMMSDALSHSVLPGLVVLYVVSGDLSPLGVLIAATFSGVLTAFLIEFLQEQKRIKEDTATGLVFSSMFALGVLLLQGFASKAHIDAECLLYGELAFVPLESKILGLPQSLTYILGMFVFIGALLRLFHKELMLSAFHSEMAASQGLPVKPLRYGLMTLVSAAIIVCFQALGAVLVIAFLVIPPSFGLLLGKSFKQALIYSTIMSAICVPVGLWISFSWDNNIAANIISFEFIVLLGAIGLHRYIESQRRQRVH